MKIFLSLFISLFLFSCLTQKRAIIRTDKIGYKFPEVIARKSISLFPVSENEKTETEFVKGKDSIVYLESFLDCPDGTKIKYSYKEIYRIDSVKAKTVITIKDNREMFIITKKIDSVMTENVKIERKNKELEKKNENLKENNTKLITILSAAALGLIILIIIKIKK